MNDNELIQRLQDLERQVFGMTFEKNLEYKQGLQLSPAIIKKLHDEITRFDPKGSRFVYRVRKIKTNYGLNDGQMQSFLGIIKAVYEGRTKDIYSIKPAVVEYPKIHNSFWDELISSFDCEKLGHELESIKKRLDELES